MKKIGKIILILVLGLVLSACSSTPAVVYDLDGIWADGYGNAIYLDSKNNEYLLQTQYGRLGYGEYKAGSYPKIYYDEDTSYRISYSDVNSSITFKLIGNSSNETLDGMKFNLDDHYQMVDYSIDTLVGTWANDYGTAITIYDDWSFYYQSSFESDTSYLVDNHDGYGICFLIDGYYETIGYNDDESIYFITSNNPIFSGDFYYVG